MRRVSYYLGCLSACGAVLGLVVECAHAQIAAGAFTALVLVLLAVALSAPLALVTPLPAVSMRRRRSVPLGIVGAFGVLLPFAVWVGDKLLTGLWIGAFRMRGADRAPTSAAVR